MKNKFGISSYLWLLIAQVLFFVWLPHLPSGGLGDELFSAILSITLVVSVAGDNDRRTFRTSVILGIPALGSIWLHAWLGHTELFVAQIALVSLFLLHILYAMLRSIMRVKRVSTETILASICSYILIGFVFAFWFTGVWIVDSGAFAFPVPTNEAGALLTSEDTTQDRMDDVNLEAVTSQLFYFSFVTLTTLGYGDVRPVSKVASYLAAFEAIVGQLYLTVLVALLVGMFIVHNVTGGD